MKFFATVLAASVLAQTAYAAALPKPAGNTLVARGKDQWGNPIPSNTCGYIQNPFNNVCSSELDSLYTQVEVQYTQITEMTVNFDNWFIPVIGHLHGDDDSSSDSSDSDDEHHHHHHHHHHHISEKLHEWKHDLKDKAHEIKHDIKDKVHEIKAEIRIKLHKIHLKLHEFHERVHAWKVRQIKNIDYFFHRLAHCTRAQLLAFKLEMHTWKLELLAGIDEIHDHFHQIKDELELCGDAIENSVRIKYADFLQDLTIRLNTCRDHVLSGLEVYARVFVEIDTHTEISGTVKVGHSGGAIGGGPRFQ